MRCVVTGANGFIGRALLPALIRRGHAAVGWRRSTGFDLSQAQTDNSRWSEQLQGVDAIIHLAAHVHAQGGDDAAHHRINCQGTLHLAAAALAAGVKRFIFISTAKVFGEGEGGPYSPQSPARPQDAYSRSKWEAERGLLQLTSHTAMQLAIIRPPLVYGAGVGANFARLIKLASLPIPLPLAAIDNRRDMIGLDNLVDLIVRCVDAPLADAQLLLCSDGHPYSLAEVVATIRRARGKSTHLFALPAGCIRSLASAALGKAASRRLFGDFELDIAATQMALDWRPPLSMETILRTVFAASARAESA